MTIYDNTRDPDWDDDAWQATAPWVEGSFGNLCARTWVENIDQDFSPQFRDCPSDDFLVHYSGFIRPRRTGQYIFYVYSDDGFYLKLGKNIVISDWLAHGPDEWNAISDPIRLLGRRTLSLDAWYFENGGEEVVALFYSLNGGDIQLVPSSWFVRR